MFGAIGIISMRVRSRKGSYSSGVRPEKYPSRRRAHANQRRSTLLGVLRSGILDTFGLARRGSTGERQGSTRPQFRSRSRTPDQDSASLETSGGPRWGPMVSKVLDAVKDGSLVSRYPRCAVSSLRR